MLAIVKPMTPAQLTEAGEALFGHQWQTQLSRELGVSDRQVRRMLSGERAIREEHRSRIVTLLSERGVTLDHIRKMLGAGGQEP
jgi:hypothetical protein